MNKNYQNSERPKFLPSFIGAIQKEAELTGWWAIIPYWFLFCAAAGGAVAHFMPDSFWAELHRELSVTVYIGLLTFNGLILALGWTAFGRIYDVLLRGDFGKYLMKNDLLNEYILQISYMHLFQIGSAIMAVIGLISVLLDGVPFILLRVIFGATLVLTIYAIRQAVNAVTAMNDLVWQSAFFETHQSVRAIEFMLVDVAEQAVNRAHGGATQRPTSAMRPHARSFRDLLRSDPANVGATDTR